MGLRQPRCRLLFVTDNTLTALGFLGMEHDPEERGPRRNNGDINIGDSWGVCFFAFLFLFLANCLSLRSCHI